MKLKDLKLGELYFYGPQQAYAIYVGKEKKKKLSTRLHSTLGNNLCLAHRQGFIIGDTNMITWFDNTHIIGCFNKINA